jgi:regulator of sirC expression with transglutaminase-like and TPR domain
VSGKADVDAGAVFFAHVAQKVDEEIDLAAAALLVADDEYEALDVPHYLSMLDGMAEAVRGRVGPGPEAPALLAAMNHHLFEELGFRGNEEDYYDPKNSFLNEVLDRRVGIPITLSIIFLEVGWRLGLPLSGVSFPGHFLVRLEVDGEGEQLLDPYHGGTALGAPELEDRLHQAMGPGTELSPDHMAAANKRQVLTRMLNNLRGIYQRLGDRERELSVLEKLTALNPRDERLADAASELRKRQVGEDGAGLN